MKRSILKRCTLNTIHILKALHKINVLSCFKMAKLIDTISQRLAARSNRQKQQTKARSQKGKHRTFETNTGRFSRRAKSITRSWFQRQKIFNVGCTKKRQMKQFNSNSELYRRRCRWIRASVVRSNFAI